MAGPPPFQATQQPMTDEAQAQAALEAINQQIQGLGGQAPEQMGPPGFLERLFNSGAGEPTYQPMGIASGFLQGLAGGLASRGQKVAQKRQQVEALIEQQRQAKAQQTLKDLESKRAGAQKTVQDIQQFNRENLPAPLALVKRHPDLAGQRMSQQQANTLLAEPTLADKVAEAAALAKAKGEAENPDIEWSPDTIQKLVDIRAAGGEEPKFGFGKVGAINRKKYYDAIGKSPITGPGFVLAKANLAAEKTNLSNLTKMSGAVASFGETAEKNLASVERALKTLPDLGAPIANAPLRGLMTAFGSKKMSAFNTAMVPVRNEFTRLLNSPTASGVITNDMRDEIQHILDPNASVGSIRTSIKILRQDFKNRKSSIADEIKASQDRIGNIPSTPIVVIDSNGDPHTFLSQSDADAFKQELGLQ